MTGPRGTAARATVGAALALAVGLGASGCTSRSSEASAAPATTGGLAQAGVTSAAATTEAAPEAGSSDAPEPSAGAPEASAAPANNGSIEGRPVFQDDPTAGRSIVFTATMTVEVPKPADVATQANRAAALAYADNGFVFSRDGQAASDEPNPVASGQAPAPDGVATADLTLKVPPAQYDTLMTQLQQLGHQLSVEAQSQDVTDKVVDTQSRLSVQKASVARIRTLLSKATTIGQIVEVEGQLTQREADLEAMEGTLAVLKSQTALATVTVHLQSKPPVTQQVVPPKAKPKKPIHGFLGGLRAGGRGFATVAIGVATVLGAALPFLGLALVVALLAWWSRRTWTRSHRHTEQATP